MSASLFVYLAAMALVVTGCGRTQEAPPAPSAATTAPSQARAILRHTAITPGQTSELGIIITLAEGWHTYADPPGDSGMAPMLSLNLPAGLTSGGIQLPAHDSFTDDAGTTYGFEDAVLLRVPLTLAEGTAADTTLKVTGKLNYLVCKEECIPQSLAIDLTLNIAQEPTENDQWPAALEAGGWKGP